MEILSRSNTLRDRAICETKQVAFRKATIPFFGVAIDGWRLALRAFARESKKNRIKQQLKCFFLALINPHFAAKWFEILQTPDFLPLATHRPRLFFKPFRVYMSIQWKKEHKVKVISDTYRFIRNKSELFDPVITSKNGFEIARFMLSETIEASLILGYEERFRKEGEMVLFFNCEQHGGMIAAASFSFEEIEAGNWICRIGCVQGHIKNADNSAKAVQKLLHGLRPKSLVVFALQELSRQLEFTALYGSGDTIQAYRGKHLIHLPWRHSIQFDYNAIWSEVGGQPSRDGWYEIPLTPVLKTIQEVKSHKRSLYTKRYRLLDDLSLRIADTTNIVSRKSSGIRRS